MAINSKKKGNRNERKLGKLWQAWTGWEFNRVPASGGLRWKKSDNITGDIICTEPGIMNFKFSIETKSYKDLDFHNLVNGNKICNVAGFWEQAMDDANRGSKIPILFMRSNGMKSGMYFVIISLKVYMKVFKYLNLSYGRIKFKNEWVLINSEDLFNSDFQKIYDAL